MAVSRQRKEELVGQYTEQIKRSKGIILAEYRGMTMAQLSAVRQNLRPLGGTSHVIKNRLLLLALSELGMTVPEEWLANPTAVGLCFEEVPAVARALRDAAREYEAFRIKGALVGTSVLSAEELGVLANLPPREVLLAQVLGAINAPASQITGVIASGIRQVLSVLQAYADKLQEPAAVS